MPLPKPVPGLVVRDDYLWHREYASGQPQAAKTWPACIVLADDDGQIVYVPITHAAPSAGTGALETPTDEKRRLGLDDQPSWVVVDEVNLD